MSGLLTYPADTFKASCRCPWVLGCEAFAPLVSLPTLRMGLHRGSSAYPRGGNVGLNSEHLGLAVLPNTCLAGDEMMMIVTTMAEAD